MTDRPSTHSTASAPLSGNFARNGAAAARLHFCPTGFSDGPAAKRLVAARLAWPLAGGERAFTAVELWLRAAGGEVAAAGLCAGVLPVAGFDAAIAEWPPALAARAEALQAALTASRGTFAGLELPADRPLIMGVVNVTPDSFSDGGRYRDPVAAIAGAEALLAEGADILDIGGESTRPGADPVPVEDELARVLPVIVALARRPGGAPAISIDTRRTAVMDAALAAGARIVNDVTALTHDPAALALVAARGAPVVLMHIRGEPRTMQQDPQYADVVLDVADWLAHRIAVCRAAGIAAADIAVDPGIGFGKTAMHNLALLSRFGLLQELGVATLVGVSRKSFIARVSGAGEPADARLPGSLAALLAAVGSGASIVRVHDVAATRQALALRSGIAAAG